jgi:hypothetical protein
MSATGRFCETLRMTIKSNRGDPKVSTNKKSDEINSDRRSFFGTAAVTIASKHCLSAKN